MSEIPPNQVLTEGSLSAEEEDRFAHYLANNPEPEPPAEKRDCALEVAQLEAKLDAFEREHSLADLEAITYLEPENQENHPIRTPARDALVSITTLLLALKNETNISNDEYDQLMARRKSFMRALGSLRSDGSVCHDY